MTNQISSIPTNSKRSKMVSGILSDILKDHRNWHNPITALIEHPILTWAEKQREKIAVDPQSIIDSLLKESEFFGISGFKNAKFHIANLKTTEEITRLTRMIISESNTLLTNKEKKVISGIHGLPGEEISVLLVNNYYRQAVEKISDEYLSWYDALVSRIYKTPESADLDIAFVYHNTNMLIDLYPILSRLKGAAYNLELEEARESIWKCIGTLKTYPFNGNELYEVIRKSAYGLSEREIASHYNRSQKYVRNRYAKALTALSVLLWGFVPLEVITADRKLAQYK